MCNETLPENETVFEYINTVNIPTDTYVSALTFPGRSCFHVFKAMLIMVLKSTGIADQK